MLPQLDVSTYVSQIVWLIVAFAGLFLSIRYGIAPYFEKTLHHRVQERQALQATCTAIQRQINEAQAAQKAWFAQQESEMETFFSQEMMAEEQTHDLRKQDIQNHFEAQLQTAIQALQREAEHQSHSLEKHSQKMAQILSDHFQLKAHASHIQKQPEADHG